MDIWNVLRITLRRWYVAVPMLALGVVASYVVADRVAIEYTSDASMLLVNPETVTPLAPSEPTAEDQAADEPTSLPLDPTLEGPGNPWLSFSGSLNTATQAIQLSMVSQETVQSIADAGLSTGYTVTPDRRNPILLIEVTSPNPETTQRTLERLLALVNEDLARRQEAAGAPDSRRIHAEVLAMDTTPERTTAARLRVQLLALGLGVLFAMFAAVVVDALAAKRRRRGGRPEDPPTPDHLRRHPEPAAMEASTLGGGADEAPVAAGGPAGRSVESGTEDDGDRSPVTVGARAVDDDELVVARAVRRHVAEHGLPLTTRRPQLGGRMAL